MIHDLTLFVGAFGIGFMFTVIVRAFQRHDKVLMTDDPYPSPKPVVNAIAGFLIACLMLSNSVDCCHGGKIIL